MIVRETAVQRPRRLVQGGLGLALGVMLAACGTAGNGKGNEAPIANAGPAQSAKVDVPVTLDGSASADPEGVTLAFFWGISSKPAGSKVVLPASSASAVKPTFTPDVAGEYVFRLMVSDGVNVSAPAFVKITAVLGNYPPVADAGKAQTVGVNALVTLDGSASSDRNNDRLTFAWTLTTRPEGSGATLDPANTVSATFTPDLVGTYVASLVVNDGQVNSAPATVTITAVAGNLAPVADPSMSPTNAVVGRSVKLNGRASKDGNNDPLTYAWTLIGKPATSTAALAGETTASPEFTPDLAGTYVAELVVYDGKDHSQPATVTVTAVPNVPPVANAGPAQNVIPGALATLDGTGSSDANGDHVTYAWTTLSSPAGSAATLANPTTAHPSFMPDVAGSVASSWQFQLVVNDGLVDSAPTTVTITTTSFTASLDAFTPYLVPTTSTTSWDFSATKARAVTLPPIRFFSGGDTDGRLQFKSASGAYAVYYNGSSFPKSMTSTIAENAVVDLSNSSTAMQRYVSMPYRPVAGPVTITANVANGSSAKCTNGQLLFVKADGTVFKAIGGTGSAACSGTPSTVTATLTDPMNTEIYVLYNRANDSGGGLRLFSLTITQ